MRFISLDTETGGLDPKVHGITEIGAVAFDLDPKNPSASRNVEEFGVVIRPNMDLAYTPYALQLQDNTLEYLEEYGVSEREAWVGFAAFLQKHLGNKWQGHIVAQYSEFDHGFLAALAARCGDAELLPVGKRCEWLCTKNLFRLLSGLGIVTPSGCGFEDILRWYGFWYDGKAHTALVDARAGVQVFRREISDLKRHFGGE
jgi:DNA polymerase III epsilon subunit-like protein